MCLAVPVRVTALDGPLATVEVGGVTRTASVHLLDDVAVGDYVIVHAGFALARLDEAEALETLRLLAEADGLAGPASR